MSAEQRKQLLWRPLWLLTVIIQASFIIVASYDSVKVGLTTQIGVLAIGAICWLIYFISRNPHPTWWQ